MVDYIGKSMIVDTRPADGGAYFEKDHFDWRSRNGNPKYNISIRYEDIKDVVIITGAKKRVDVTLKDGKTYSFFLYRAATFVQFINAGREVLNQIEEVGTSVISDQDLERLSKLSELHNSGVLDDAQFESQKNAIMSKYSK